jgi:hypothetical protein
MAVNASLALAMLGGAPASTASPAMAVATFRRALAEGAEAKGIAAERKDPTSLRVLTQFTAAIGEASDLKRALGDPRVLAVLLPAVGLADKAGYPALVQRALMEDPGNPASLPARLGGAWKDAAATLNLHATGLAGLQSPATVTLLTDAFLSYQYRTGLDAEAPGVSDALYFREKAGSASDVYTILGDAVMRRVVTGALGLPASIAVQPVETQARAVASRLDLDTLQSPAAVEKLALRYLISRPSASAGGWLVSLFA